MFGYGINRKAIYIVLGILVLYSLLSMTGNELLSILLTLPAVVIAISFHEFAHALAADRLGDTTPRSQGRLTLNPLMHIDPFGFVLLMFANIGWGKPVEINPNNFTSNKSRGTCEAIVSIAGPAMNFLIAIVLTITKYLLYIFAYKFIVSSKIGFVIDTLISITISINIGLGVFNLIPLPPLDGEKIFKNILPSKVKYWLDTNYQTLYWVFIILWITGFLGIIVSPLIRFISNLIYSGIGAIFSLFL